MVVAKRVRKSSVKPVVETFEVVPLSTLRSATINDQIYKPVDILDPSVQKLADDITSTGFLEPLVITTDNVIVSGHRRRAACLLMDRETVPVKRLGIPSTDPTFPRRLVEFNSQRVKGPEEMLREELVRVDPADAHCRLLKQRVESTRVKLGTIRICGETKRARFSASTMPFLQAAKDIIVDMSDDWPLTVRTVHYQLLNNPPLTHASKPDSRYVNLEKYYKKLSHLLIRARLFGNVPLHAIEDETRASQAWDVCSRP